MTKEINDKFQSNIFTYFIDKLSNSWLPGFLPHMMRSKAQVFAEMIVKKLSLSSPESKSTLSSLFSMLAEKMATTIDGKEAPPLRLLLTFFGKYAEGALLFFFNNLFCGVENADKAKANQGGFLFDLMIKVADTIGEYYKAVFDAKKNYFGHASDGDIKASLKGQKLLHEAQKGEEEKKSFYEKISRKLIEHAAISDAEKALMPSFLLSTVIELITSALLPLTLAALEEKAMHPDMLDSLVKSMIDKMNLARNTSSVGEPQETESVEIPEAIRGKFGKVVRTLFTLIPTLAIAPLLEIEQLSQMADDQLDQIFVKQFHGTNFFQFLIPMMKTLIPAMMGGELVESVTERGFAEVHLQRTDGKPLAPSFDETAPEVKNAQAAQRREEIKKSSAALLIKGTEKLIQEKASQLWGCIETFFKKIWGYISWAIGGFLSDCVSPISNRFQTSRFAEPVRRVGDLVWSFIDYLFSGIILTALKTVAFLPYWIFTQVMTLYLKHKAGAYLDELHRKHHRGAFYHFLQKTVEEMTTSTS